MQFTSCTLPRISPSAHYSEVITLKQHCLPGNRAIKNERILGLNRRERGGSFVLPFFLLLPAVFLLLRQKKKIESSLFRQSGRKQLGRKWNRFAIIISSTVAWSNWGRVANRVTHTHQSADIKHVHKCCVWSILCVGCQGQDRCPWESQEGISLYRPILYLYCRIPRQSLLVNFELQ